MSASAAAPGTTEDRTAFIRAKNATEGVAPTGGKLFPAGSAEEEEAVGTEGADAVSAMLSTFDDSDDEEG